jgi:hypothetical protein
MRKIVIVVAVVCSFAGTLLAGSGKIEKKAKPIRNSYLVMLDDAMRPNVRGVAHELTGRHGGRVKEIWTDALRGFYAEMSEASAEAMARDPRVLVVEEDEAGTFDGWCTTHCFPTQTSSHCANGQVGWQLDRIDQPSLPLNGKFEHCVTLGEGVKVYVIDSGIKPHEDFTDSNGNTRISGGISYINDGLGTSDCYGHGTTVASFAVGRYSGAAKAATVVPVRVGGCTANSVLPVGSIVTAVNWVAADHTSGPAVANMSLSFAASSNLDTAVNNLVNDGVFFTNSAGNANVNGCSYSPARATNAFTVGATTNTDAKWSSSNYGSCVQMFAPGAGVGGAHFGQYAYYDCSPGWSGTSQAAPLVAGVAAVAYGALYDNGYNPSMIRTLLINSARTNILTGIPTGTPNRLLQSKVLDSSECPAPLCVVWCDNES